MKKYLLLALLSITAACATSANSGCASISLASEATRQELPLGWAFLRNVKSAGCKGDAVNATAMVSVRVLEEAKADIKVPVTVFVATVDDKDKVLKRQDFTTVLTVKKGARLAEAELSLTASAAPGSRLIAGLKGK
jgi:hypothetical protein